MSLDLSWVFLGKEEVQKGAELDKRLDELNQAAFERGEISAEELERRRMSQAPEASGNYRAQVNQAWDEGWREGEQTVVGAVSGTVSAVTGTAADIVTAPLKGLLFGLPWWAWILGIVGILAWTGTLPGVALAVRSWLSRK